MLSDKRESMEKAEFLLNRVRGQLQDALGLTVESLDGDPGGVLAKGAQIALGHARSTAALIGNPKLETLVEELGGLLASTSGSK